MPRGMILGRMTAIAAALCGALLSCALGPAASGQTTYTWVAPGGGTFDNALNWSRSGGPPGVLDTARFLAAGSVPVVTFAAPRINTRLVVEDADVTLQLSGHAYTLQGGAPSLSVLTSALGALRVSNGTLAVDSALIDSLGAGAGALHVQGNGSWTSSGQVVVGGAGHGIVTLSGGAQAIVASTILSDLGGSDVDVILSGGATRWNGAGGSFIAGEGGNGILLVELGAKLQSLSGKVAAQASSGFTVIIDGLGSSWTMPKGPTTIGESGLATVRLQSGASMSSGSFASIADAAGSTASMFISGQGGASTWSIAGDLHVGAAGSGSLTLVNPRGLGAIVTVGGEVALGSAAGGSGTLLINGGGAFLASNAAFVAGDAGQGTASVQNAAGLHTGSGIVGRSPGSSGQVAIDGPGTLWTNNGDVVIGQAGPGLVTLSNSALLRAVTVSIGAIGALAGSGQVQADLVSSGVVSPGNSAGMLLVTGAFTQQSTGTLEIEIGGVQAGTQHDVLSVSGAATLGGALDVSLIGGFEPRGGEEFTILTAGSITGRFARLIAPPGISVSYTLTQVRLNVARSCALADLNCDGLVNGVDLAMLLAQWTGGSAYRPCPPHAPADLNQDCRIDGLDLATLLAAWDPA